MKSQRGKTPRKNYGFTGVTVTEPVEVYCRIKPVADSEKTCLKSIGENQIQLVQDLKNSQREYIYTFQQVFDESSSQSEVFERVAMPLVEDLINGKNGLLFNYGVTGSGKTYTMTGNPKDQGVLPRCLDVIFNTIECHQAKKYVFQTDNANGFTVQSEADAMTKLQNDIMPSTSTIPKTPRREKSEFVESRRLRDKTKVEGVNNRCRYAVFLSYIEIYNNGIFDLLEELVCDPITGYKAPQNRNLREDSNKMMYVHSCTEVEVKSPDEAFNVIYAGQSRRKVARTTLNEVSSRSHSVFNIRVVQAPLDARGEEVLQDREPVCVSQLSLVDLAGSERTVRTKNQGDRLKEAANINNTLMVLRNCIEILRENQKFGTSKIIPYRDSKLTHLFKTYLEGDGKVRMIVCVNPISEESGETLHVMKFAEMTREVTVQRQEGHLCFPENNQNGRLYPNLDKESSSGQSSSDSAQRYLQTVGIYSMGPSFPTVDIVSPWDDAPLKELDRFLCNRINLRSKHIADAKIESDKFRKLLLHVEKENAEIPSLQKEIERLRKENQHLRQDHSQSDKVVYNLQTQLQGCNTKIRELERKLTDRSMQVKMEKTEKSQLKMSYENRLQINREKFERDMEQEKQKMERQCGARIQEKIRKLNLLKTIVNEPGSDTSTSITTSSSSSTPRHTMKLRTFQGPATAPRPAPVPRKPVGRLPTAKSLHDLNQIDTRPKSTQVPATNPKHRRSKSSSNAEIWLEHKVQGHDMETVLQPKLKKKRSVSKLTEKNTKDVNKYCLNHQEIGSDGELRAKFYKGDVAPTVTGGRTMVFSEVEEVKLRPPGNGRKRHSSCSNIPEPDKDGQWTDVDERCSYAINGYGMKKTKGSHV